MASVATNFSAFLFLFPIGLHRLISSSSLYLHNPSHFRSKLWYFSDPKWKNIDLFALIITLPIASFSEFFLFLSLSGHPSYKFSFFHQSFTLLAFWVLIILIIGYEYVATSSFLNESFVFVIGGVVFLVEYYVMSEGVSGLAGVVYGLFGGLTLVCAASCFYLSVKPNAFFADFSLSCGLVFKGTWLLQAGFSLYTDAFGLRGCQKISSFLDPQQESIDVKCDLDEDRLRGVALMNLLFTLHALVVMVLAFGLFGVLASIRNLRGGEARGPLLSELESTSNRVRAIPELEME
ncbi:PREDICTED: uncharacterized protein LOC109359868 [Lupinus angustifolius]|uniref:uncharacterized protein LOC109359868 n=1 Tax=Lupinus angustifolius TaxID=3871 RepID=UPI00092E2B42|nr:PREDICTED: uncharacterized protein LOC109359868 [Lupinus angustifolius]